ncbi:helix-turn-helix domain-containing protein [Streptomyces sp. NPDC053560]|uniref:helix-turn-helix domain-containing protein n=1 Tax=Streptomyces sp. NPDC053560 TaxID=3365711 RepID=UPI0037D3934E
MDSTDPTVQDSKPLRRGVRNGKRYRPRLRGEERASLRRTLASAYDGGDSIRKLLTEHELSYGLTRTLLIEAGVTLRSKRGSRGERNSRTAATS